MTTWEIDRPTSLSSADLDQIFQLVYDAFNDHVLMRHEMDEWSVNGIRDSMGGLFEYGIQQDGVLLARHRDQSGSGRGAAEGKGEILGLLVCMIPGKSSATPPQPTEGDTPKSSYPPATGVKQAASANANEDPAPEAAIAVPVEADESQSDTPAATTDDAKRRRDWRSNVQQPFTNALFDRALGKPRARTGYLSLIATSPKAQRTGIGRGLMEEAWRLAQVQEVGMALITHMPSNVKWYSSLGYAIDASDELEVPGVGARVRYWAMSRGVHPKEAAGAASE